MHRVVRKLSVVLAIAGALSLLSSGTAYAAPGAGAAVVVGAGSIGPGLTAIPQPQSVSFGGTATGVFVTAGTDSGVGSISCSFNGGTAPINPVGDNYAVGLGNVSGTCSGNGTIINTHPITVNCPTLIYIRVGPIVIVITQNAITCTITVNATTSTGTVNGAFVFTPRQTPPAPITSYDLVGVATFAGI